MTVGELVKILQAENQTLNVDVAVMLGNEALRVLGPVASVEVYEDVVELWVR